eukprot:GEMP01053301.1.p1 GENE.GEMP01053301.1~~GEMP01053301.1.p1  ORF type:complete len:387 (+),score=58.05 GEMP01053301.1:69-1163(+)
MSDQTRGVQVVADVNKAGWEKSDFPLLCETCMGDNPYVRMMREDFGMQCKICNRPYTVFRWRPGAKARYTSTVICLTCAKIKNVCQKCIFDLEYGLPVEVRDKFLDEHQRMNLPESRVGKQYAIDQAAAQLALGDTPYGKEGPAHHLLSKLARKGPYYKRNEARTCSFFVKGTCNRGDECPFKHEIPVEGPLSKQNLRDRYNGVNDPVAQKIQNIATEKYTLKPPEDKSICTLYLGGLDAATSDTDVRDALYSFGEITSIKMMIRSSCAFVSFKDRECAEKCAETLHRSLKIKDANVKINWAKPIKKNVDAEKAQASEVPLSSSAVPLPIGPMGPIGPLGAVMPYYPSMDPLAFGNAPLPGQMP